MLRVRLAMLASTWLYHNTKLIPRIAKRWFKSHRFPYVPFASRQRAAHRDKSREWAPLKAKVESLLTLGNSGILHTWWAALKRTRNVQRFRGGLVFKAHRLLYHSTLGLRILKKKKKNSERFKGQGPDSRPGFRHNSLTLAELFTLLLLLLYYSQS